MSVSKRDVPSLSPAGRMELTRSMSVFNNKIKTEKPHEKLKPKYEEKQVEVDGPKGPEPTRYGDWERKGRCIDF